MTNLFRVHDDDDDNEVSSTLQVIGLIAGTPEKPDRAAGESTLSSSEVALATAQKPQTRTPLREPLYLRLLQS